MKKINRYSVTTSITHLGLFLLSVLTACEPEYDLFQEYVIKKGEHYSSPNRVQSLQSNTLSFIAEFNASAIYDFEDAVAQDSKNKLLGFSDCNSLHHENSARFAWQWNHDQLEIYAYCYVDGVRVEKFVGIVNINEVNHYEITLHERYYTFSLNKKTTVNVERGKTCSAGLYYMLWPYFGGSKPAPHQISIRLKINY